jgi:hypothetical protein
MQVLSIWLSYDVGAIDADAVGARGRFGSVSRTRRGVGLPGALGRTLPEKSRAC